MERVRYWKEGAYMQCPTCSVPLVMSERQGIEIDYCPQCRGVWLDRGELDKIIERSMDDVPEQPAAQAAPQLAQQAAPPPPPGYGQAPYPPPPAYGYGHHPYHKRRKHWLHEIFD